MYIFVIPSLKRVNMKTLVIIRNELVYSLESVSNVSHTHIKNPHKVIY